MFLSFCYITVQDSHIVAMTLFKHKYSHSILFGQLGINSFHHDWITLNTVV